jgi:hypothetical protein
MKKITLVLLSIMLVYGNCKDADEILGPIPTQLPELTLKGNYYMSCLIENRQWINAGNHVTSGGWSDVAVPNLEASLLFRRKQDSTKIQIYGNMYTSTRDDDLAIEFSCKGLPNLMEVYSIETSKKANLSIKYIPSRIRDTPTSKYSSWGSGQIKYISSSELSNSANISFVKVDTVEKIISGVFYAKVFDKNQFPNGKISDNSFTLITQGRFDVKYQSYITYGK